MTPPRQHTPIAAADFCLFRGYAAERYAMLLLRCRVGSCWYACYADGLC